MLLYGKSNTVRPFSDELKLPGAKKKEEEEWTDLMAASVRYQTREFFENSTLHGVRYIAEKGRPILEKFMWFCFTSVGAVAACIIIVSLWEKFQTNPTITGLDTDFHNWDVPFPAITLCDHRPADDNLIEEFINRTWPDATDNRREQLSELMQLLVSMTYEKLADESKLLGVDGATAVDIDPEGLKSIVFQVTKHCEELFHGCQWKADPEECCEIFYPVFTEVGFCYAFNAKNVEKVWPWQSRTPEPYQEQYIHETDTKWSLIFNSFNNETRLKVFIHSSDETIGIDMNPQHIWDRRVEKISFSVKQTYTTEDARQLSIKQRRCVFWNEIKLATGGPYTYSACMRQCRMKLARTLCGCVPHFYPKVDGFRYCKLIELMCIARHAKLLADVTKCNCELGCFNTIYEVEKLTEYDASKLNKDGDSVNEYEDDEENGNPLETEFVSWPMVRYKREVLFGWVDLLVSFGGIAGLFLGFSLLSGVEIIYYFTLRAFCAARRDTDTLREAERERKARPRPALDLSLRPIGTKVTMKTAAQMRKRRAAVTPQLMIDDQLPKYSPPPVYTYLP